MLDDLEIDLATLANSISSDCCQARSACCRFDYGFQNAIGSTSGVGSFLSDRRDEEALFLKGWKAACHWFEAYPRDQVKIPKV
jgi:hypothetical protein